MPNFSKRSLENKEQCHEDLQIWLDIIIKYYDCSVICGYRGKDAQDKAYDDTLSDLKFPQSKHNRIPSLAVDVVPYPLDWKDIQSFIKFGNYALGVADTLYDIGRIKHRLRWGGNWKKLDYPHFEIIEV